MRLRSHTCERSRHGKRAMLRPVYVRHWRIPHCRLVNKTMPRAVLPARGIESPSPTRRGHRPGRSSKATGLIAAHPASLPASARSPRAGAVWPPPLAPRRCRRVALAVALRGRWFTERSRSASARKSRKRASDTWCFSAISVPNMAVDVSPGVIPICRQRISEARSLASRSAPAPWRERHGHWLVAIAALTCARSGLFSSGW